MANELFPFFMRGDLGTSALRRTLGLPCNNPSLLGSLFVSALFCLISKLFFPLSSRLSFCLRSRLSFCLSSSLSFCYISYKNTFSSKSPTYEKYTHHQRNLLPIRNALCPIRTGKGLSNRNECVPKKEKFIRRNLPAWRFISRCVPLQVPCQMFGNRTFGS